MSGTYGTARSRKTKRQQEAKERAERYGKLTLDEKIEEQLTKTYKPGKQLRKLITYKEKKG